MTPAEVPAELVEAAERTLAFGICADNRPDGKCDCPTDEQIRVVLAAVLPLREAAVLDAEADETERYAAETYWRDDSPFHAQGRFHAQEGAKRTRERAARLRAEGGEVAS